MRNRLPRRGRGPSRRGFTLIELLVVVLIVLMVSAVTLPTVISAISHRQVGEAARLIQGAIAGARDAAIHANAPRGFRLLPDPNYNGLDPATGLLDPARILAFNRLVPIEPAPDYSEGLVNVRAFQYIPTGLQVPYPVPNPNGTVASYPLIPGGSPTQRRGALMVEQSLRDNAGRLNSPTSWYWNVRVGDKIRIGTLEHDFTVVGPMVFGPADGNPELFVNIALPGQAPAVPDYVLTGPAGIPPASQLPVEYLILVNGLDDNGNGLVDEGWDGINNNLLGEVDDLFEWEEEAWPAGLLQQNPPVLFNQTYTIHRRPSPSSNVRQVDLPPDVVIDATTWGEAKPERSRIGSAINRYNGTVDILFTPQGEIVPTTIYSTPASSSMGESFLHLWLAERDDLHPPQPQPAPSTQPANARYSFLLPMPADGGLYDDFVRRNPGRPVLEGESRLITLFSRTGQVRTTEVPLFNPRDVNTPFIGPQQDAPGGR